MFTGIVRELGEVAAIDAGDGGARLTVRAPETAALTAVGDSVSVNGVCLTAVAADDGTLAFDAVPETLERSALARLAAGSAVNLEPALRAGDAMGGHIVQGHVDGIGTVRSADPEGEGLRLTIEAGDDILRYCVDKGSITLEGVSLTIAGLHDDAFEVALIPHTLAETTLASLEPGRLVNLEVDVLAKYVERLLIPRARPS